MPSSTPKPTSAPKFEPTSKIEPTATTAPEVSSGIYLEGASQTDGIRLKWRLNGVEAPNGFKVVKSTDANPSYPGDAYVYQSAGVREYVWKITNGQTYHFRVCKFEGSACQVYSNDVGVTAPNVSDSGDGGGGELTSITTSVQNLGGGQAKVTWSTNGGNPNGFKVVWSHNAAPVYPPRSGDGAKWVSGSTREYTISGLSGNYYFRVCEYSGGCKLYSNEVSASF